MRFTSTAFVTVAAANLAAATAIGVSVRHNGGHSGHPGHPGHPGPSSQCNTGTMQCCNSVQSASSPVVSLLTNLFGGALGDLTGQVGLTCSPLTGLAAGGTSCSAQPVCCTGNSFNGLFVLGCSPINFNL